MPDISAQEWFLRVDDVSGVSQLLPDFFRNKDWGVCLAVRESVDNATTPSVNPHYHILLKYKEARTKSTIIKYFKKIFTMLNGNDDFGFKSVGNDLEDKQKIYRYMCKGKNFHPDCPGCDDCPEIIHNPYKLNCYQYHIDYWQQNKKLTKRTKEPGFMDRVIAECIKELTQNPNNKPSFRHICEMALRASKGKLNHQQSLAIVQAVMYHFHPEETENNFHARMLRAFSPS